MMNWKNEKPLRGGKGLIKLSYCIYSILNVVTQHISCELGGGSPPHISRSREVFE